MPRTNEINYTDWVKKLLNEFFEDVDNHPIVALISHKLENEYNRGLETTSPKIRRSTAMTQTILPEQALEKKSTVSTSSSSTAGLTKTSPKVKDKPVYSKFISSVTTIKNGGDCKLYVTVKNNFKNPSLKSAKIFDDKYIHLVDKKLKLSSLIDIVIDDFPLAMTSSAILWGMVSDEDKLLIINTKC